MPAPETEQLELDVAPPAATFDGDQADLARVDGVSRALRADRITGWRRRADQWLADQPVGVEITADKLVAAVGLPDTGPARNNAVGGWMSAQAQGGRIRFTGRYTKSARPIGHGNLQRIWVTR